MSDNKQVTNWEEQLAQYAMAESAVARPSTSTISLRAGVLMYEKQQIPNNKLPCLVLDAIQERTYYDSKYDPDKPAPPACFALGPIGEDLAPHSDVPEPQSSSCATCPQNEWGSSPRGGRGKACQERKRMVLIPITSLNDAESVRNAEVATLKLPVTSGKNWDNYVINVAATKKRPTFAVVTEISVKPDPKTQFRVEFNMQSDVDLTLLGAIMEKREMVQPIVYKPYDLSGSAEGEAEQEAPKAKGNKHRA